MNADTILLLSTPVYDSSVGAAKNHIINNEIGEYEYNELKNHLEQIGFDILKTWGTFASQKDYKKLMQNTPLESIYNRLHEYFDSDILSNIMAPLFPEQSRNVMWKCKIKN